VSAERGIARSEAPGDRGVARLEARGDVRFPRIAAARALTASGLAERRRRLAEIAIDQDATVVLTGSWGRREATAASDDDFMVVFTGALREGAHPAPEAVAGALGGRRSGQEAIFHRQVSLDDLRGKIGRDEDSNANLTRRMLLILESVAVAHGRLHASARRALLAGYLEAHSRDYRPPRFLLNDLIRYWRTIAVDFESKMRARQGEGWGLRNAKLRLSRKALFAGGLLPVLQCYRCRAPAMLAFLAERMAVPPLDRIADAFVEHQALDAGVRALRAYDDFLGILDDPARREELGRLSRDGRAGSALWAEVLGLGEEFEAGLLSLLFDDPELRRWVREHLIF
jgi:hypothetical protein